MMYYSPNLAGYHRFPREVARAKLEALEVLGGSQAMY